MSGVWAASGVLAETDTMTPTMQCRIDIESPRTRGNRYFTARSGRRSIFRSGQGASTIFEAIPHFFHRIRPLRHVVFDLDRCRHGPRVFLHRSEERRVGKE